MPFNEFKPSGVTKASEPDAGGGNVRTVPVLAIVKSNIDPIRQGRLQVYIVDPSSSTDPNDSNAWVTVSYMSPFFGRTTPSSSNDGFGDFKHNVSSYGEWHSPPDIGTTVVCIFINGDMNYGYYIGCVPEPECLQMVPAIGATDNIVPNQGEAESFGGALKLPVTNINTNNSGISDSSGYLSAPKPVHSYASSVLFQQGLLRDPIRGPISTSSQRETPSRVGWGVSTPGRPIYEGGFDDENVTQNLTSDKATQLKVISRRGGHSIVMDDGDLIGRDQLVRIRTALGHQILMSDDGQTLFIIHSNGQSYIELGKEGTIDMYSTNSVNIRTQGDLNLHADNNININATKNFNINAENININSEKEYKQRVGTNYSFSALGQYTTKVAKQMSFVSGADASFASTSITYINGSKINLNTGSTSLNPQEVKQIPFIAHTDSLFDKVKGWAAAPGKLISIVSRAPAHAPWASAGQGVDVKVDLDSSTALAASPNSDVSAVNEKAASVATNTVTPATVATIPPITQISPAVNAAASNALVAAVASSTAASSLQGAVTNGAAVLDVAGKKILAIGPFALTPDMLEAAGIIKPGSATIVKMQTESGFSIQDSLPDHLFAGKPGAENLEKLIENVNLQATTVAQNMSTVQQALTNLGIITGQESPTQIAGMLVSGVTLGIGPTVEALQQNTVTSLLPANFAESVSGIPGSPSALLGNISGIPGSPSALLGNISGLTGAQSALLGNISGLPVDPNNVLQTIGAGNFAANLSETLTGGLGGITNAVDAMNKDINLSSLIDKSRGAAAAAFSAITESFKPLKAGVPQNLSEIMSNARKTTNEISNQLTQTSTNLLNNLPTNLPNQLQTLVSASTQVQSITNNLISNKTGILSTTLNSVLDSATSPEGLFPNRLPAIAGVPKNTAASSFRTVKNDDIVGSLAGASAILNSPTSILGSLNNAASSVSGSLASSASAIASGISMLPGGQSTIAQVFNGNNLSVNIPGASDLNNLIGNVSSSLQNNLPNPAALLAQAGSLTNLIGGGLSASSMSQLISAITSLSSGSSTVIKMPSVSTDTFNRSAVTNQVSNLLGDKGIPAPNYSGIVSSAAKQLFQTYADKQKQLSDAYDELSKLEPKIRAQKQAYIAAKNELPAGDPKIEELKQIYYDSLTNPETKALLDRIKELSK